jgi:hypothetical protein
MIKVTYWLNKSTEWVFGAGCILYMFLSFVETDVTKQRHFLVVSLLAFLCANVLSIRHDYCEHARA